MSCSKMSLVRYRARGTEKPETPRASLRNCLGCLSQRQNAGICMIVSVLGSLQLLRSPKREGPWRSEGRGSSSVGTNDAGDCWNETSFSPDPARRVNTRTSIAQRGQISNTSRHAHVGDARGRRGSASLAQSCPFTPRAKHRNPRIGRRGQQGEHRASIEPTLHLHSAKAPSTHFPTRASP